jgi:hypothetical protein
MKKQNNIYNENGLIIISKGKSYQCLFDKQDNDLIKQYHWFLYCRGYATTKIKRCNGFKLVMMHRLLLGLNDPNINGDHINHNRLDNRRCNIRICTPQQNQKNRVPKGKSKYMGVTLYFTKYGKARWIARIYIDGKQHHLGTFDQEARAAKMYDSVAKKIHGEFANLNFK